MKKNIDKNILATMNIRKEHLLIDSINEYHKDIGECYCPFCLGLGYNEDSEFKEYSDIFINNLASSGKFKDIA